MKQNVFDEDLIERVWQDSLRLNESMAKAAEADIRLGVDVKDNDKAPQFTVTAYKFMGSRGPGAE